MQVTQLNDVKVYNLSAGKSLPQFLEEAQKKNTSLRYNEDFRRRIDLIQDFHFNVASSRVRVSPDGEYIAASGMYPPEMRMFDTHDVALKFSRGLDGEIVDFRFLSDDWRKLVFLQADRYLEFQTQFGRHHRLRVPKPGRDLCYDSESCTLFVGGSAAEVYRIDLEAGIFVLPVALKQLQEVNSLAANPVLPVLSCAGDQGLVESYDLRDLTQPLRTLKVSEGEEDGDEITCCAYSDSGMQFAAGTSAGIVRVYDIRSSRPITERDHMNGSAIRSLAFHSKGAEGSDLLVASADCKSIKVWSAQNAALAASVECKSTINQVEFVPKSGLFFVANDQERMGIYFVPSLGLAPKWCSFLDSMTEELEESKQKAVFDDYRFVTNEDLEQLGASQLLGSKYLQPYMHGYFMDQRLHAKLQAAMEPFAYQEYRKQRVRQKVDAKRQMRTEVATKVKVNPKLHESLEAVAKEAAVDGVSKKRKLAAEKASKILADERFKVLFADPDFAIEERQEEAAGPKGVGKKAAVPNGPGKKRKGKSQA